MSVVIDTNSRESINRYLNNLSILERQAKEAGKVDKFLTIREDDFFPYDYEWTLSCKNTGYEKRKTILTEELRSAYMEGKLNPNKNSGLRRLVEIRRQETIPTLPRDYGMIQSPVVFRSTKHFTVNTPLGYTGDYNFVESGRNFVVIDDLDLLANSPYAYSISYRDAYLDVTHEDFPISKGAIILVTEEKYNQFNPIIKEQLKERNVVFYRGSLEVAINMILAENGVLPYKPGVGHYYDPEISRILESSIQNYCLEHGVSYNLSHGGIDGVGGHFTGNIDSAISAKETLDKEFIDYLRECYPTYRSFFTYGMTNDRSRARELVKLFGVEGLNSAIERFNSYVKDRELSNLAQFKQRRSELSPNVRELFRGTIKVIKDYYSGNLSYPLDEKDILAFYSDSIEEQIKAALKIQDSSFVRNSEDTKIR